MAHADLRLSRIDKEGEFLTVLEVNERFSGRTRDHIQRLPCVIYYATDTAILLKLQRTSKLIA